MERKKQKRKKKGKTVAFREEAKKGATLVPPARMTGASKPIAAATTKKGPTLAKLPCTLRTSAVTPTLNEGVRMRTPTFLQRPDRRFCLRRSAWSPSI